MTGGDHSTSAPRRRRSGPAATEVAAEGGPTPAGTPAATPTGAAEEALERLFRLTVSRTMYARQAAAVGAVVTRAGYAMLRSLDQAGPLGIGELARQCAMDPAAVVRQVNAMQDEGLVTRAPDADDARVTIVTLTEAGRAVYLRIVAVRTAHLDEVLTGWSDDERLTLTHLVDRLVDGLMTVPFRPHLEEPR